MLSTPLTVGDKSAAVQIDASSVFRRARAQAFAGAMVLLAAAPAFAHGMSSADRQAMLDGGPLR